MKNKFANALPLILIAAIAPVLTGCWTTPNAYVQPGGEPGLIQDGIVVSSIQYPATVRAIDVDQRLIHLALPDGTITAYKAAPNLKNFDRLMAGQTVKATVTYKLAVYLLANGRLPDGTTAEALGVNARVLQVDPSYRLLTLQYPNGQLVTFKPGLHARMQQMAPGDSVVVRPFEVTAIKIKTP